MNRSARNGLTAAPFLLALLAVVNPSGSAAGADAGTGKDVFERRCSGCHAADTSKEGPLLRGVVGRKAGTASGMRDRRST
jgi:cytochrome c